MRAKGVFSSFFCVLSVKIIKVFRFRHCSSVPFPQRQQIPRFGAVAESHSAWPLATGSLIIHLLLPPSEGVQNSRVFVPPSEGVRRRHCFESALYQRFSSHRGIPTFQRCAVFPRFRPTFRRCAEASLLREHPVSAFFLPPCISLPAAVHFPPSESVQNSRVFVPPSEGVQFQNEKAACSLS